MAKKFMIQPGSAEACAKHRDELAAGLDAEVQHLHALTRIAGFGGFKSGVDLEEGFGKKAGFALDALKVHSAAAREVASKFRASGVAFENQDVHRAEEIASVMGSFPNGSDS